VLTLSANEENRQKTQENIGVAGRLALFHPPAFSKVADWLAFRNAAIKNSFENSPGARSLLSPRAWPRSPETLVFETPKPQLTGNPNHWHGL
jgi:hypothetical protein